MMNEVTQFGMGNFTPEVTDNTEISTASGTSTNFIHGVPCNSLCLVYFIVTLTTFVIITVIAVYICVFTGKIKEETLETEKEDTTVSRLPSEKGRSSDVQRITSFNCTSDVI